MTYFLKMKTCGEEDDEHTSKGRNTCLSRNVCLLRIETNMATIDSLSRRLGRTQANTDGFRCKRAEIDEGVSKGRDTG